jgi:hypothetical protein
MWLEKHFLPRQNSHFQPTGDVLSGNIFSYKINIFSGSGTFFGEFTV